MTTAKLVAPFVPFLAEALWQNLAGRVSDRRWPKAYICATFPAVDQSAIDELLSARMQLVREIVSLGRSARMNAKLKVRQPLAKVEVILADQTHQAWLEEHASLVAEELNVKQVEYHPEGRSVYQLHGAPGLETSRPTPGQATAGAQEGAGEADAAKLLAQLAADGVVRIELPEGPPAVLDSQDLQVRLQAKPGWAAAQGLRSSSCSRPN